MATVGAETATRRSAGAIWTLVVVALATFMLMLDLTVVNVALPDIRAAFGSSFSALQWILDAYALGLAAVLLAAGSLADRLGRKRVFDAGLVIFVLSSLACGLAPNDLVLIVARFVQGLGGAILFAVGPALLGHEFRGKDRGMAFGVFGGVTGLAIAFGPLIGGGLTETAGWRWIFLINVPVTIAALVIGYLKVRESRSDTPPPVDWPGMITFSAGLFFLVLGFMRGEQDGWTSLTIIGCFALAVVLLAVFTRLQITRPGRAMFDLSLFGSRTFNGLSAVTALCALTVMPALFLLISYVQNMLGYSAFASGLRFLPLTLLLFVAAAVAGSLVTKLPPAVLVGVSQLLIAGGLLAVVLVDVDSAWTALIPAMILIGLGMGVFNPPRAAFSIAVTTPDKSGMASGINETFQQAGVAIGIAAVGAFFQNRVAGAFTETDTARRVFGEQVDTAGDAVAAAGPSAVLDGLPASVSGAVRAAAETAFVDGLRTAMVLAAVLAAVSGVIAFCTMRRSDLDPAALENPGVPADAASADVPTTPMPVRMAKHPGAVAAAQRAAQIIAEAKAEAQRVIGIDNAGDTGRTATDARTAGKPDLGKGTRRTGAADRAGTAGRTTAASRTRTTDVDGAAEPRARRGRASSGNGAGNGAELRPGARKSASPGEPAGRSSASASASASAERTRSGGPRSGNAGQPNRTTGTDTEHTRQTTRRTRESARTTGSRTTAGDATRAAESATANEPSTPTRSTNGTRTARSSSNPARTTPAGDPTTRRTNATDAQRTAGTGSERVADSTPTGSGSTPAESAAETAGTGPAGATAESDFTADGNGGVGQRSRSTGGNGATGGRHARTSGTTDRPRATVGGPSAADRKSARMTGDRGAREPQKTAAPENRGNSGRFAPSAARTESATEQPRAEADSAPVAGRAAQTAAATGTPAPRTTAPRTSGGAGRHARATRTRTTAGKQSGKDGDNTADLGTSPDDNQTPAGTTAEARNQTAPGQTAPSQTAANQAAPDQPAPGQPAPNQPAPGQAAPGQVESASATPKDASHAASTAPSTPASAPGTSSVTPADATAESPAVATTAPTTDTKHTRTRRTTRGSSTTAAKAAASTEQVPANPADSATPAETTAPAPQPAPEQPAAPAKSSASTKSSPSAAKSTPTKSAPTKSAATKSTPTKSGAAKSTTPKATAAKSTARKRPAAKSTGADSATGTKSSTAQKSTRSTRARSDDTGSAPEN
ncbi:drug resistance transporter, EmrB/QacA subfamily [Nocardia farcinica]|uniref:Spectinomycin tetracycline efflux pump n=1 Tax=Nocardia farcinica TaxID=37329 RepID=A0A0H5P3C1_NOCFR|nr:DHA2 family efflux MFS transporter permease subunit [Nocardia farcinica]CRY82380.1 Spectinomycin tetracycline efflux pump [Nocardia farcinica]SIT33291.1 drug resistance transporter, EmrB/QacA subfamily [Nocardia farcinica]